MKKLLNKKMKLLKSQKGLTLIELLVVIVILGIIAAVAIPMISSQTQKAKDSAAAQTNAIVKDAAARYEALEGSAPSAVGSLVDDYIKEIPTCPEGYKTTTDLSNYCQEETE